VHNTRLNTHLLKQAHPLYDEQELVSSNIIPARRIASFTISRRGYTEIKSNSDPRFAYIRVILVSIFGTAAE